MKTNNSTLKNKKKSKMSTESPCSICPVSTQDSFKPKENPNC